jgi:hypothetical protein
MGLLSDIGEHVQENKDGMVFDLVFAVVWVTFASLLVEVLQGPEWALYLALAAGIPAYYGFVFSLDMAKAQQRERES